MRVLLIQLDGKMPNLALMRLGMHFRLGGHEVRLRHWAQVRQVQPEMGYEPDAVYASAIFDRSMGLVDAVRRQFPNAVVGGTGSGSMQTIEEAIGVPSGSPPDYDLYPRFTASLGFSQRGCRLKCPFCVVPKKEGAMRPERAVTAIWRGEPWPKHLLLLDNDFFGQPEWRAQVRAIREGGFRVCFSQGINARMIDEEVAEALASLDYYDDSFRTRRIYTAWDNRKDEARLFAGLDALVRHGVKPDHIMVYILVGYWPGETHEDREYRRQRLREFGARPYPMPYQRTQELVGFQRWVVGAYDKRIPWPQWAAARYEPRRLGNTSPAPYDTSLF